MTHQWPKIDLEICFFDRFRQARYPAVLFSGPLLHLPSTVVFFTELLKMLVSFCLESSSLGSPALAASSMHEHMTMSFVELLKVSFPSLLY